VTLGVLGTVQASDALVRRRGQDDRACRQRPGIVRVRIGYIDQDTVDHSGERREPLLALAGLPPAARAAIIWRRRAQQDAPARESQFAMAEPAVRLEQACPLLQAKGAA
jgi:hypothetical protein